MDDVSPLRRRMIEDMTVRNLSPRVCRVVRSLLVVSFAEASLQGGSDGDAGMASDCGQVGRPHQQGFHVQRSCRPCENAIASCCHETSCRSRSRRSTKDSRLCAVGQRDCSLPLRHVDFTRSARIMPRATAAWLPPNRKRNG